MQQLQAALPPSSSSKKADAGDVAARTVEAGDQASLTGSPPTAKTIGIVVVAALAASAAAVPSRRSPPPGGGPNRPPAPAVDRIDPPPSGIRSRRSGPRHSRFPSSPCRNARHDVRASRQASGCRETRSPASPAAAPAPRAATPPPRRRAALTNSRRLMPGMGSLPGAAADHTSLEPPGAGGLTHQEPAGRVAGPWGRPELF